MKPQRPTISTRQCVKWVIPSLWLAGRIVHYYSTAFYSITSRIEPDRPIVPAFHAREPLAPHRIRRRNYYYYLTRRKKPDRYFLSKHLLASRFSVQPSTVFGYAKTFEISNFCPRNPIVGQRCRVKRGYPKKAPTKEKTVGQKIYSLRGGKEKSYKEKNSAEYRRDALKISTLATDSRTNRYGSWTSTQSDEATSKKRIPGASIT